MNARAEAHSKTEYNYLACNECKENRMNGFDNLLKCSGSWRGMNRLKVTPDDPVDESSSQLIVTPILRNTFIRLDQTWSWKTEPQSGSLLIGHDPQTQSASIHWIDTWHNGTKVMLLIGEFNAKGVLIARGHFAVKDSPDWGWRIEIQIAQDLLKIDMFCINPAGPTEVGWVWSEYRRTV